MSEKQDPALFGMTVIPSDTVDMSINTRGIYVGTTGDLTVIMDGGDNTVLFANVPAGTVLPIQCQRIKATGTTADNIVALY